MRKLAILWFVSIFAFSVPIYAQNKSPYNTAPLKKPDGSKWRIAYLEAGGYESYLLSLKSTVTGLMELGWIETMDLPVIENPQDTKKLWEWLNKSAKSEYLEFPMDLYWTANWDKEFRVQLRDKIIKQFNEKKDVDLIITMGTWAGQDMANDKHSVPTIVASTTDAVAANIVKSAEDSGFDHVNAKVDPTRHERQVELFHDIIGFQHLGIAYENTPTGRGAAAIDSVERVAKARNFEIVRCHFDEVNVPTPAERAVKCYQQLANSGKVNAVYITRYPNGVTLKNLPNILDPLNKNKIPTFSQGTSEEVQHGVLLSIALAEFKYVGQFYARTIATAFHGVKLRDLPQEFKTPPKIAINLKTAQLIGYDPPIDILGAADEIFQDIMSPK